MAELKESSGNLNHSLSSGESEPAFIKHRVRTSLLVKQIEDLHESDIVERTGKPVTVHSQYELVQLNTFLKHRVHYLNSLRTGDPELDHRFWTGNSALTEVLPPSCLTGFSATEEQNTAIINPLLRTYKTRLQERINQERKWPSKRLKTWIKNKNDNLRTIVVIPAR